MSDNEVPPPYSEQQLDQKVARALVISVQQHEQDLTDDGEWEQWDDAVFAAAEARRKNTIDSGLIESSGSERNGTYNASRLPVPGAVQPLRIHKRRGSSISGSPGTLVGGMVGESPYESSSSRHALRNGHWVPHDIPPESDDDDRIPPPPFTSLDARRDGIVRLEYHAGSTPPSPLNSPDPDYSPLPPDPRLTLNGQNQFPAGPHQHSVHFSPPFGTGPRPTRQSLPIPPRSPNYHLQRRAAAHPYPIPASPHPVLDHSTHLPHVSGHFGQYVKSSHPHGVHLSPAYKKTVSTLPSQSQSFAANALYNSSVSCHLSSPMPMQPRVSHSSRQHRSPQITQSQPPEHTSGMVGQLSNSNSTVPRGVISVDYLASQSMPHVHAQGSYPSQHPTNATYFPQHPSFPSQHGDAAIPRWATSEQQLNQNFQT